MSGLFFEELSCGNCGGATMRLKGARTNRRGGFEDIAVICDGCGCVSHLYIPEPEIVLNWGREGEKADGVLSVMDWPEPKPSVQAMLDLSTAHMPSEAPDFGEGHRIEEHDYGFLVFVAGEPPFSECAEWLRPIMVYANEAGCVLINFDRDADAYPDLFQTWEW